MALTEYHNKRKPGKTPEPAGGSPKGSKLHFVVQQHAASHMHYDFRLEMKGTLKSWAVPKGPSMDPDVRRSAFMVEDHPYDYKDFEGNIPNGNYGAGSVIIWDEGTYEPVEKKKTKKEQESHLLNHLHKGAIEIVMHGKKLKGRFVLVHMPERDEKQWLLVKVKDRYATKKDILLNNTSVVSGLTVQEMKTNSGAKTWKSNRAAKTKTVTEHETGATLSIRQLLKKGKKSPMPSRVTPMGATLVPKPFDDEEWLYEVKFDGYRIISHLKGSDVLLHSKSFLNFTKNFEPVTAVLKELNLNAVLDGEVIAVGKDGKPDYQALQQKKPSLPLQYYVFDILWLDGYDLTHLPLVERKEILKQILVTGNVIKYSDDFDEGVALFEGVQQMGLEGIIAKKKESTYVQKRSREWQKMKITTGADVVLGGWTESESSKHFRSLIFGYYDKGKLRYFGHVGHGFNKKNITAIRAELQRLATNRSPFAGKFKTATKAHWLKPERVIRIKFDDITESQQIRKPVTFIAFRDDMDPRAVTNPIPELNTVAAGKVKARSSKVKEDTPRPEVKSTGPKTNDDSNWPGLDKLPVTRRDMVEIEGNEIELTNLDKEYWGDLTKGDLINYYIRIAPYILPHLKNRPLSLHIKHVAPAVKGLYIKDMEGREPAYADIHTTPRKHKKKGKRGAIDYLVSNNLSTLVYAVNLGCIDLNPWTSTVQNEHEPDFIIIDLDPSDDDFKKAITAAQASKQFFDEHQLKAFVKTSGKTGIHLFLPCTGFNFTQARTLAENICGGIHALVPAITTTNISVNSRGSRLYLDPNQNDYADTVASAYSARPHGKPTVSTPLDWKEVKDTLSMDAFTITSIEARLQKKGDLFAGVYDQKIAAKNSRVLTGLLH